MKKEKTTLIKPKKVKEKEDKKKDLLVPFIMFLLGLIFLTNSSKAIIIVCYIIGAFIMLFGIGKLISYYHLKQQLKIEDNQKLVLGILTILMGLIVIILSGAIEAALRFIIGAILILNGLQKTFLSINYRNTVTLVEGIVLIAIGLYTILAENIILQIVGAFLILSSIIDVITYFKGQKK